MKPLNFLPQKYVLDFWGAVQYTTSRYYPMEFLEKEVSGMFKVAKEIKEAVIRCL